MSETNSYRIELSQFQGPFDLLLFFIERDELDIHDLPLARITADFLEYMQAMQEMDIDLAAEFIFVASTLMRIKAKMLLPRPVYNEEGEEIDPREELVKRLLEYKRYKSVVADLIALEEAQTERGARGYSKAEEKLFLESQYPEEELYGLDLYAVMKTFKRIWDRHKDQITQPAHVIRKYPYDIEQVKEQIESRLRLNQRLDFVSLILEEKSQIYLVFCFLGILELVQAQKAALTIGEGFNNFWINHKEPDPEDEAPEDEADTKEAEE